MQKYHHFIVERFWYTWPTSSFLLDQLILMLLDLIRKCQNVGNPLLERISNHIKLNQSVFGSKCYKHRVM